MQTMQPLMLGLVGDGASGKTTLVRGVVRLLGNQGVTPICLDDYYRYSRTDRRARGLTEADPAANDLELMMQHLATLRAGGTVRKPFYEHRTGTLRGPEEVAATGLVLAYGMLTLALPDLLPLFDLTVYLEPDQALRRAWRLARDVRERGYTAAEVMEQRERREGDAARFIRVQRVLADVVVRFHDRPSGSNPDLDAELILRRADRATPLDPLLARLQQANVPGLHITQLDRDDDGKPADLVTIDATISQSAATAAAMILGVGIPDFQLAECVNLGQIRTDDTAQHSRSLALTQMLIVRRLLQRSSDAT
ncbi:phosphoribulokinase [Candidatus Chloroploca asiatica]|nr:phosphoribulokinase [Candidatus Chloroploca asiatica]